MARVWLFRNLSYMEPATIISAASLVCASIIYLTMPIAELQTFFWAISAIGFIGDSITTGYFNKFGLEEQERGFTRWACGAEPTLFCASSTRVLIFGIIFGLYSLAIKYVIIWEINYVRRYILMIPIVFGLMSIGATAINSYEMWRVSK